MSIFTGKAGSSTASEVPPAGSRPAVLVAMIDLGSHWESFKDEKTGKPRAVEVHKIYLAWELTSDPMAGMKHNHVVGKSFNLPAAGKPFHPKNNLRKLYETWHGKTLEAGEDMALGTLLGQRWMIGIKHQKSAQDNIYAKLDTLAAVSKGADGKPLIVVAPPKVCKPFSWEIGSGPIPEETWLPYDFLNRERVPLATIIKASQEWRKLAGQPVAEPPADSRGQPPAEPPADSRGQPPGEEYESDPAIGDEGEIPF